MRPSDSPIGYLIKRVHTALRRDIDAALNDDGLSMAQYAGLTNLAVDDPLTNAELARRSIVTPQTMIRIVNTLEDNGWIKRTADPANKRRVLNSITAGGRRRHADADKVISAIEAQMMSGMTMAETTAFRTLLARCANNLDAGS